MRDEIISSDEVEIVHYGLEAIESNLLGLSVVLTIGSFFGYSCYSFILWLLVFPLRKNAGGYHARTRTKCVLVSTGMVFVSFLLFVQMNWSRLIHFGVITIFAGIIFMLAPIDNCNKQLDLIEQHMYRKRTRIVLVIEMILYFWVCFFSCKRLTVILEMCFFIVGTSLLFGKLQKSRKEK